MQQEEVEKPVSLKQWYEYAVNVLTRHGLEAFITEDVERFLAEKSGDAPITVLAQIVERLTSSARPGSFVESNEKLIPGHKLSFSSGLLEITTLADESAAA